MLQRIIRRKWNHCYFKITFPVLFKMSFPFFPNSNKGRPFAFQHNLHLSADVLGFFNNVGVKCSCTDPLFEVIAILTNGLYFTSLYDLQICFRYLLPVLHLRFCSNVSEEWIEYGRIAVMASCAFFKLCSRYHFHGTGNLHCRSRQMHIRLRISLRFAIALFRVLAEALIAPPFSRDLERYLF